MFKSLYNQVGFLIAQDITSDILSKSKRIAINIQQIILQLECQS